MHGRTRPGVVRNELLFREGDRCDPGRLAESARVLRALPFLRDARIVAVPVEGGVAVAVLTRDEWSFRVSARLQEGHGALVRRMRLTEENLLGRGIRTQLRYDGMHRHPGFDLEVTTHQFLRQYDASVIGGHSGVGFVGEQRLLRPFESEYDRTAWRESSRYRKEPFVLFSPAFGRVDQPVVAISADLGAAVRGGSPGRLVLAGAALSGERLLAEGAPQAAAAGDDAAAATVLAGQFSERRRIRVHLFGGARALRFHPHYGLDAVRGVEDAREGVEVGVVVGKSVFGGVGLQRDWFAAGELFFGGDFGRTLAFARGKIEGRYVLSEGDWNGILFDGQLLAYTNVNGSSVFVLGASASGGWHTRTPFQLLLGGPTGMRGYGINSLPVGRRVVLQGEHRYFLGTVGGTVDLGTAVFVDVGRGWASSAVFGEDTGLRAAVGIGLRAAAPHGSRRTYRADLTLPLTYGGRGLELQVGVRQQFGITRGEAEDVARSREQVSSTTIFNFPRF